MAKLYKVLFINILVVFIILVFTELICNFFDFQKYYNSSVTNGEKKNFFKSYTLHIKWCLNKIRTNTDDYILNFEYRKPSGLVYERNKPAILLIGDSYTYGDHLKDDETFGAILSKNAKIPVYNIGISGSSPREILYIFSNPEILKTLLNNKKNFKYVIYTYINEHKYRLYYNTTPYVNYPCFKVINNQVIYYKPNIIGANSCLVNKLNKFISQKKSKQEIFNVFSMYIFEIKQKIEENLYYGKNSKPELIVLVYDSIEYENWNKLKKNGIKVIKIPSFVNPSEGKYLLPDGHPSSEFWQSVVPYVIKELNL